jgi:hypothetical protein
MASYIAGNRKVLADLQECCMAFGALHSLGEFCCISQLHYLAAEFLERFSSQPIQIYGSMLKSHMRIMRLIQGNRILPHIHNRTFGLNAMSLGILAIILIAAWANLAGAEYANPGAASIGLDAIWGIGYDGAPTGDSSSNRSNISLESQNNDTGAPVSINVGTGYYSSHPVAYNSAISSQTQLVNKAAAVSMHHSVQSAKGISGSSEYMVRESENIRGDSEYSSTTSTQMRIDENVIEGKVHIGALQGSEASGWGAGRDGRGPTTSAWKNPAIEIDEEYIGTYHISKNITFSKSDHKLVSTDSWLNCCSGNYFDIFPPNPVSISADDVFSYTGK